MATFRILLVLVMASLAAPTAAEELSGEALVEALRGGGYTLYFRHAPTDWSGTDQVREAGDWTSCDPAKMRQLSDEGRETARRAGAAIRRLGIPVGRVLSSEYCRSAETARLLELGTVETTRDVMNMRAAELMGGREAVVRRAQAVFRRPPPDGSNTVVVGHGNLMRAATGAYAGEAGCGIYVRKPGSERGFELVAELTPEDWMRLAERFAD